MRPDIRRLETLVLGAEAASGMAKAPFYPRVQAVGAVEGAREGDPGLSDENFGNTLGVQLAWNLYAGGADRARLTEARQARREAVATLAGLRNEVAGEIRRDLALLASAAEQVRLQRETVALVEENRELAQNEYEAGESPLIRLNEAQRDLVATYTAMLTTYAARGSYPVNSALEFRVLPATSSAWATTYLPLLSDCSRKPCPAVPGGSLSRR